MGIIDWIILLFLLCFIVQGWRRGLAGMIVRSGGIVASFFLIGHFFPLVKTSLLANYKMGVVLATIIALLLIIVLMIVLIRLVMYFLQLLLKSARLTTANKFLGMGLGFLNGLLVVIVFTMMMDYIPLAVHPAQGGLQTPGLCGRGHPQDRSGEHHQAQAVRPLSEGHGQNEGG